MCILTIQGNLCIMKYKDMPDLTFKHKVADLIERIVRYFRNIIPLVLVVMLSVGVVFA